jgi:DegV family protein with EDD domain
MGKVALVTDTISCIPFDLVKQYDIRIVPVGLVIDRQVYKDTELSNDEFWKLFHQAKEPITTNAGNPADFEATFSELAKQTDRICCCLVSKQLSATFNMACQARDTLKEIIPSLKIEIIDSKSATGAEGFIVLEAARAAEAGNSLKEVAAIAQDMANRVKFFCAMSTLKYLRRCGRAPKSAFIGDWLKVKPILGMINGSGLVENLGRERGMDKAIARIIEMVGENTEPAKPLHIMIHYTDNLKIGEKIRDIMASKYHCNEVHLTPYTAVMSSQTGPVVAIAFYQ